MTASEALAAVTLDWSPLAVSLAGSGDGGIVAPLAAIAQDGGSEAIAQISVGTEDLFSVVNAQAVEWAQDRAAEMVGMKWVDGELIPNPNAYWQITESTRSMVSDVVELAEAEGWSVKQLADALIEDAAFSPERAMMIARTETALADMAGSMIAYRASGVVVRKKWLVGIECCPACEELDGETVGLDDEFSDGSDAPPKHPNCRCSIRPIVAEAEKIHKHNDNHDQNGRFASGKGGAFTAGALPVDMINATLGMSLAAGDVRFSAGIHQKLMGKHAADYKVVMANIKSCLRDPDLIGVHPEHPGKVSLVKYVTGLPHGKSAVVVAVSTKLTGKGYGGASAYGLRSSQIKDRTEKGHLKKAKTR